MTVPVPHPHLRCTRQVTAKGQDLTAEQRSRLASWLEANGVRPGEVAADEPITVEYKTDGQREWGHLICFSEYYRNHEGHRTFDYKAQHATLVRRNVQQSTPIEEVGDA
ncbi:hypothetical protein ACN6LI_003268 [Streptomyces violaceoruber]